MNNDVQSIIKSPYQKVNFSEEQIVEFMRCADPVTGPEYFMSNYFYIQHPVKGKMLYQPFSINGNL